MCRKVVRDQMELVCQVIEPIFALGICVAFESKSLWKSYLAL